MKKRVIALLLCAVMLVTCMGVGIFAPPDIKLVDAESGEAVSAIAIPQSERVRIATDYESTNEIGYQWQLSTDGKTWINIYGQTGESIQLSYAMICNMLSDEGTAQVRCVVTDGDSEYETREAEVSVDYSAPAQSPKQAAPAKASAVQSDAAPQADETGTSVITINYVYYKSSAQAANPWTATIPESETLTQTVESPTVVGYEPDKKYVEVDSSKQTNYTVTYYPADVNFTVKHYLQNITNDEYTLDKTENKIGKTESAVGDLLAGTYTGFTALLYDTTTKIAADGSTVVEIYYDRNYYLLSLDLDGGYGAEPMYARYGTDINIADPTKAGYTFVRWSPALPKTILAENMTCKADWKANDKAKVTVVIWGENADNENYSYQRSFQIEAEPGTKLTQADLGGQLICGGLHTHNASSCGINCRHEGAHSAGLDCYGVAQTATPVDPNDYGSYGSYDARTHFENNCNKCKRDGKELTNLANGTVCRFKDNSTYYYYLYFNGGYYRIDKGLYNKLNTGIGQSITHGNDTYSIYTAKCIHTHTDSCYACGLKGHTTHDASCYYNANAMDSKLWKLVRSDTVTVEADGTTVMNLYYDRTEFTLTFKVDEGRWSSNWVTKYSASVKWGEDTTKYWNKAPSGYLWYTTEDGTTFYTNAPAMPQNDLTVYGKTSSGSSTVHYCEKTTNKQLRDDMKVAKSSWSFTDEDYIDIPGFKYDSNSSSGNDYYVYYTRNSYTLSFNNRGTMLDDKKKSVLYEAALKQYEFMPEYPSNLEPDAYKFEGWYTTESLIPGTEVNFETATMPAKHLILFAKWVPVTHTVTTHLTEDSSDILDKFEVTHGKTVDNPPEDPTRTAAGGDYTFVGWFYRDENGTEKAFNFSMEVRRDLELYAKWSSNVLVKYTVRYELADGTEIAPPSTGSALAGTTKTFEAKSGDKLNEGYKTEYYPKTSSHSVTMDIDGGNEYTFEYVKRAEVSYTVKYLEKGTGNVLHKEKSDTTSDAVITEHFEAVKGYAPDAYQKKLVLSANDEDNVIIFWYTKDEVHAPVQIIHWIQNVSGNGYTEYQSSTNLNGVIGNTYSESPLTIKGFKYNAADSNTSGKLTEAGLVLNLRYDRIDYPYEFRFLEQGTNDQLTNPITGQAPYETLVSEAAKEIAGYTLVSSATQSMTIGVEDPENVAQNNVKTFYYKEKSVDIKYEVVGPAGCGTLTNYAETVKVLTGEAQGSTAAVSSQTYKFVGWYSDAKCEHKVSNDYKYVPEKNSDGMYEAATYYAKFEYNVVDLTITKEISGKDSQQLYGERSFVFHVKGTDENTKKIDIDVVVKIKDGETSGSTVLKALPIGSYTITEDTGWSWRYGFDHVGFTGVSNHSNTDAAASCTLVGGRNNAVTFTNSWLHAQWLSFTTSVRNIFGTSNNK